MCSENIQNIVHSFWQFYKGILHFITKNSWGFSSVVEHLDTMYEALSLNLNSKPNQTKKSMQITKNNSTSASTTY